MQPWRPYWAPGFYPMSLNPKESYKQRVLIESTYLGVFQLHSKYIKHAKFEPEEKVKVKFSKNMLSVKRSTDKDVNLDYYTHIQSDGSIYLRNPNWNGLCLLEFLVCKNGYFKVKKRDDIIDL